MNMLNTAGLSLVGLLCVGFMFLMVASLLGWKITGEKIMGTLTAPFRFLFSVLTVFPEFFIKDCFGFLSINTVKGLQIAQKEVNLKMLSGSIIGVMLTISLSALVMALTKSYTGKYFLIGALNANEETKYGAWYFLSIVIALGFLSLYTLNLPRRFCRSDKSFKSEAENMGNSTQMGRIIAHVASALISLVICPPVGFILLFQLLPEMSYFSVLKNERLREEKTLEAVERKKLESPTRGDSLLRFLTKQEVDMEMRLVALRTRYFYGLTYLGVLFSSGLIIITITTLAKML
jgi:hypothetical protein